MYLVKIRQAQYAIKKGNLDDAFAILSDEYLAERKEGRDLLNRLADSYLERANQSVETGQYDIALENCVKAGKCRVNDPEILALESTILEMKGTKQRADKHFKDKIATADDHIANGMISVAMDLLGNSDHTNSQVELLRKQGQHRRQFLENIAEKVENALSGDDLELALELVNNISDNERQGSSVAPVVRRLKESVLEHLNDDFSCGRLSRFMALFEKARIVAADSIEYAEWQEIISSYKKGIDLVNEGNYRKARNILSRITKTFTTAEWLNGAVAKIEDLADLQDEVESLLPEVSEPKVSANKAPQNKAAISPRRFEVENKASVRQIAIDGVGAYYLFTADSVRLGPVSSAGNKDIAYIAQPNQPIIDIYREEGDYFAKCDLSEIEVNTRRAKEILLHHNDKLALTAGARAKFLRANPASLTAVIDLSGIRLINSDIKGAVLAGSEIIIGNSSAAHIKCYGVAKDITVKVDQSGNLIYNEDIIKSNETIEIEGLSFSIT